MVASHFIVLWLASTWSSPCRYGAYVSRATSIGIDRPVQPPDANGGPSQ